MKRILFFLLLIVQIATAQTNTNFVHKPVDAAQNIGLPAHTYSSGVITASANGAIGLIDSVTMALGSRILIWRDSTRTMNGIYIVTDLGSGGTPFKLTRDPLANIPNNMAAGSNVYVRGGYWFGGKTFTQTTTGAITIGSTNLLYVPTFMPPQNNNLTQLNTVTYATHGTTTGAHFRHQVAGGNALYVTTNPSLQMINSSFTVAGYVWHDSITSLPQVYINKDDDATQAGSEFYLGYYPASSKILMQVETGTNNTRVIGSSSGIPSTGAWHFVVGWFDRDLGRVYIQVDNGTIDSTTADASIHVTNTVFALGAVGGTRGYPDSCCSTMNGTLSSWGLWKRTLSAIERTQLYNSGVPIGSFHALPYTMQNESRQTFVSYWALNETSGTRHDRDQAGMAAINAGAINVLTNPMVDQTVPVNITGTGPSTATSNNELIKTAFTTASTAQNQFTILNQILAGATDAVVTAPIYNINGVAGTGAQANGTNFGGAGNYGSLNLASGTTATGHNVGSIFSAQNGLQNYGFISNVTTAKNSAVNSGGLIRVQNSGTSPTVNGLYINLSTSANTTTNAALQLDNGSVTSAPLILFQQNGTKLGEFANNGTMNVGNFTASAYQFHGEVSNTDGGVTVFPGMFLKNTSTANPGGAGYNYAPITVQANNGGVSGSMVASYGIATTAPYSDSSGYFIGTSTFHKIKFFTNGIVRGAISPAGNFIFGSTSDATASTMQVSGSESHGYRAITALRTLDATDHIINCTANSFTVTLPTAVGITGREYIIKNTGGATTITIATTSSQTIDGSAPTTITTLVPLRVVSDGANWITFNMNLWMALMMTGGLVRPMFRRKYLKMIA
jgi:hypothetical protein